VGYVKVDKSGVHSPTPIGGLDIMDMDRSQKIPESRIWTFWTPPQHNRVRYAME
jgi:hypothetical protein